MAYRKWDDWKDQLPAIWSFLQSNKIEIKDSDKTNTWHAIAAKVEDDKLELSGDFKSKQKELMDALTAQDWSAKEGPCFVVVDGLKFVVAAVCSLDVLEKSKSRQFGIDLAEA